MHDRGDYKTGWQLEKEWEQEQERDRYYCYVHISYWFVLHLLSQQFQEKNARRVGGRGRKFRSAQGRRVSLRVPHLPLRLCHSSGHAVRVFSPGFFFPAHSIIPDALIIFAKSAPCDILPNLRNAMSAKVTAFFFLLPHLLAEFRMFRVDPRSV